MITKTIIGEGRNGNISIYPAKGFSIAGGDGNKTTVGRSRNIGRPDTRKAKILAIGMIDATTAEMIDGMTAETIDGTTGETIDGMTAEMIDGTTAETIDGMTGEMTDGSTCSLTNSG